MTRRLLIRETIPLHESARFQPNKQFITRLTIGSYDRNDRLAMIDMSQIQRLLIIKMSAMGDIVHALPVAGALKETFPHLRISWAVEDVFAPLLTGNPDIEKVITLPKMSGRRLRSMTAWNECIKRLQLIRREHFDLTVDLQGLTKSAVVALYSGAERRLGYHWLRELATLVEQPVPQHPASIHIVDQYLDVARFLGAEAITPRFPIHIPAEDEAYISQLLCAAGLDSKEPFITINPASAQRLKEWGTAKYGALIDAIASEMGMRCVLVTADEVCAAQVEQACSKPAINIAKRTNLKQLCAVLRRSEAHVCGDTGSGHIAAALGRPVVSIVGPTDPERSCPYGQREATLSRRDKCGSVCRTHHCAFASPLCLNAVTVEDVVHMLRLRAGKSKNFPAQESAANPCYSV